MACSYTSSTCTLHQRGSRTDRARLRDVKIRDEIDVSDVPRDVSLVLMNLPGKRYDRHKGTARLRDAAEWRKG
jgi:hypothetical protein